MCENIDGQQQSPLQGEANAEPANDTSAKSGDSEAVKTENPDTGIISEETIKEKKGLSKKNKKHIVVIALGAAIILLLEVFVFNFNSFHAISSKYKETELNLSSAKLNNVTMNDGKIMVNGKNADTYFTLDNIDMPVGTVYVDAIMPNTMDCVTFKIAFADATSSGNDGTRCMTMELVNHNERSKIIPCHLTGDVHYLKFKFELQSNQQMLIRNVVINRDIPFSFSLIRIFGLLLLFLMVYTFIFTDWFSNTFAKDRVLFRFVTFLITGFMIVGALGVTNIYRDGRSDSIAKDFRSTEGDQITQEIVDAFANGQTHLTTEPSDKLMALENPYDPDLREREIQSSDYLWDHLLFEGKYYSYYGIGPVITVFLPYHLLTGYYFPTMWAVFLFSIIGISGLSLVYYAFVKKWFKNLPANVFIIGLLILQFSSGIFSSMSRPEFYEIAISSAFAFMTFGIYFLLTSNILGDGKISLIRLLLSALFVSLSVLSRPTMCVYAVVTVVILAYGFFAKFRKEEKYAGKKLAYVRYWVAAILPYAIFGSVQMIYNYLRFSSIFDFGIKYSLTINDFTQSQFHFAFLAVSLYSFIFAVPYFMPTFPYVFSSFQYLDINGFYFVDRSNVNALSVGVFFRALPVFAYFVSHKALARIDKTYRKAVAILGGLFCVLAPLVIVSSVWESGYSQRYNADFSWEIVIGALALCFIMYLNAKHEDLKPIALKLLVACAILCFIVNFGQIYSMLKVRVETVECLALFDGFERIFEFWR